MALTKESSQNQKSSSKSKVRPAERAEKAEATDIVSLILEDHKPLKRLIKIMKDSDKDLTERMAAFGEFGPLLVSHSKPEEQTLYSFMKESEEEDIRVDAFEGDVEHGLADQLLEELKRMKGEDEKWTATVKVLAELVEHHIEEEEEELLPDFRKNSELKDRKKLGQKFLKLKSELLAQGGDDSPPEKLIDEDSATPPVAHH